jgi:hypothetical protein
MARLPVKECTDRVRKIDPEVIDPDGGYCYQFIFAQIDTVDWMSAAKRRSWKTGSAKSDAFLTQLNLTMDISTAVITRNQYNFKKYNGVIKCVSSKPLNPVVVENTLFKFGTCTQVRHDLKSAAPIFDYDPMRGSPPAFTRLFVNVCEPDPITDLEQPGFHFIVYPDHTCDKPTPTNLGGFRGWVTAGKHGKAEQKEAKKRSARCGLYPHIPDQ